MYVRSGSDEAFGRARLDPKSTHTLEYSKSTRADVRGERLRATQSPVVLGVRVVLGGGLRSLFSALFRVCSVFVAVSVFCEEHKKSITIVDKR
jgi:hypothetical protein